MTGEAKQVGAFVKIKIKALSESKNESAVRAALTRLRRGIGKAPGAACRNSLWAATLDGLPEALLGGDDGPSRGEWAVHTALTLYALHQQGKDPKKQCMSKSGESLGAAVRKLIEPDNSNEGAVTRHFNAAATSDSFGEFSRHLRGLIQLMKSKDIPLDYPAMAKDMYWFQFPDLRDDVRLRWGQDFYRIQKNNEQRSEDQ